MSQQASIRVIGPAAGETVDVLGAPVTIKTDGQDDQMFFADHPLPAGYRVPPHVHADEDEVFYVLEGEVTLESEDGELTAGPGAFAYLPRGVAHGFRNAGDSPARMLVFAVAGRGLEGVFRDLAAAAGRGGVTPAQIGAIVAPHGVRML